MTNAGDKGIPLMHKRTTRLMGNRFEISVLSDDVVWADQCIDAAFREISRIEQLLTTFDDHSQTSKINSMAGISSVKVDRDVFDLISRAQKISGLTQGAFDITYGSIDKKLWNFDLSMTSLPDPELAAQSVRLINYRNVILDEEKCSVYLKNAGMRLGFGGIGKGYAADSAKRLLLSLGFHSGIVNAGGDLVTWGSQANGKPWTVAIADPDQSSVPFSTLNISNMAIATSGNYEKFVIIDGKKYAHTIDPTTGLPVSGIKSVTIICKSAELADAMATPVMVMGIKVGLDLVNQLKDIACIIISDDNKLFYSSNINIKQ